MIIDDIEPDRAFVQRASVHVDAPPHEAMRALRQVTTREMPIARLLGELRYLPGRAAGRTRPSHSSRPFLAQLLEGGSAVVAERADKRSEEIVIGGIGKYHQLLDQQPVRIPDVAFYRAFDDPEYQKLAIELAAVESDGGCDLILEAHTHALSSESKKAFSRYWIVIGPMGRFVSWLLLRAARRRAEKRDDGRGDLSWGC